jgi:DNA polymerase-3 subunit delta'
LTTSVHSCRNTAEGSDERFVMSFARILGQEKAKRFLRQVIAGEKIPHAYLFTGIPGIGKTTTAIALTMALNCQEPVNGEGCGLCRFCRQLKSGNFPDFQAFGPVGQNIRIDQIRELTRGLSFAPASGRYRVSVIHEAEKMTDEAANAFLKTLEEPLPGNIFILKATEPLDLLPTVVSRCQRVPFQPLSVQDMTEWLVREKGLEAERARVLARISGGSLGRALKMSEGDFLEKRREWVLRLVNLPRLSKIQALEMALECADENKKGGSRASGRGEGGLEDMLAVWEGWYRDLLLVRAGGAEEGLINADFPQELKKMAKSYRINHLVDAVFMVDQAQRDLRRMRNSALVMEHTVLRLKGLTEPGS